MSSAYKRAMSREFTHDCDHLLNHVWKNHVADIPLQILAGNLMNALCTLGYNWRHEGQRNDNRYDEYKLDVK